MIYTRFKPNYSRWRWKFALFPTTVSLGEDAELVVWLAWYQEKYEEVSDSLAQISRRVPGHSCEQVVKTIDIGGW